MNPFEGLTRAQIRSVALKARAALDADPNDAEAQDWLTQASDALRGSLAEVAGDVAAGQRRDREEAEPDFSGTGGAIGAAALKAGQGATFGFSDELAGLGAAVVPGGAGYREGTEGARSALRAAGRQRPILSGVSDIAASMLVPVPGAGVTGKALRQLLTRPRGQASILKGATKAADAARPTLRQLMGRGALVGGTQGAAQAAGRSEGDLSDRALAGGGGLAAGAILGGAIPLGAAVGRTALRQTKNALGYVVRPITEPARLMRMPGTAVDDIGASAKQVRDAALDVPTFQRRGLPPASARAPIVSPLTQRQAEARAVRALEPPFVPRGRSPEPPNQAARVAMREAGKPPRPPQEPSPLEAAIINETPRQAGRRAAREAYVQVDLAGGGKEAAKAAARRAAATAKAGTPPAMTERQLRDLAERISGASDDVLKRELDNPMVDDAVKDVVRQELTRRARP